MKLFQRYTRQSLMLTLAVLVAGIALLFVGYRYLLVQQVDEALELEKEEILSHIKQYNEPPRPVNVSDLQIYYLPAATASQEEVCRTLRIQKEDFRELAFSAAFGGTPYRFTVRLPLEQTEALLALIGSITLVMLLLITLGIYLLNRRLVQKIIAPFYRTIAALGQYSALQKEPLQLPPTPTEEFTLLNNTLNEMTVRMQQDVEAVRRFTAQAAHEMQTPLAAMRNQLEALQQYVGLSPEGAAGTVALEQSVEKLSRLFQSLLLLTRIEGGQFEAVEWVDLTRLLHEKTATVEDLLASKNVQLHLETKPVQLRCNPYLAEVLLQNLLFNAVRYAAPGGNLWITLAGRQFQVSNNSVLGPIPPEDLFRPFYRNPNSRQPGTGLGLSIAAQIAERSGWKIAYEYGSGIHLFTVHFE